MSVAIIRLTSDFSGEDIGTQLIYMDEKDADAFAGAIVCELYANDEDRARAFAAAVASELQRLERGEGV